MLAPEYHEAPQKYEKLALYMRAAAKFVFRVQEDTYIQNQNIDQNVLLIAANFIYYIDPTRVLLYTQIHFYNSRPNALRLQLLRDLNDNKYGPDSFEMHNLMNILYEERDRYLPLFDEINREDNVVSGGCGCNQGGGGRRKRTYRHRHSLSSFKRRGCKASGRNTKKRKAKTIRRKRIR